jgi:hypothetical protein
MKIPATQTNDFATAAGPRLRCFLDRQLVWLFTMILCSIVLPIPGWSQIVEVPCKGSATECAEKFEKFCESAEYTAANLTVPTKTRIWGLLIDPSGAAFVHPEPGLTVELRDPNTSRIIASNRVGEMGTFDFGAVSPGSYRIIAVLIVDGKTARYRGWDQPKGLTCGVADECTLAMLLRSHGSDNPIDFCPPK